MQTSPNTYNIPLQNRFKNSITQMESEKTLHLQSKTEKNKNNHNNNNNKNNNK